LWSMQLEQQFNANMSIIFIFITGLAVIYFTKPQFYPLGLLYIFTWLFIFFYMNKKTTILK
jgi:hypothetical protein